MFIVQFVAHLLVLFVVFVSATASRECTRFPFSRKPCRKKCCGGFDNERPTCSRSCVGYNCLTDEHCDGGCCILPWDDYHHYGHCELCRKITPRARTTVATRECTTYHDCIIRHYSLHKCCYEGSCYDCGRTRFVAPPTSSTTKSTFRDSAKSREVMKISIAVSGFLVLVGVAVVIAVVSCFYRRRLRVCQSSSANAIQRESAMQITNAPQHRGEMVPKQTRPITINGNVNPTMVELPPYEIEAEPSIPPPPYETVVDSSLAGASRSTCRPIH